MKQFLFFSLLIGLIVSKYGLYQTDFQICLSTSGVQGFLYGDFCFFWNSTKKVNRATAKTFCEINNGTLASVHSGEQNDFLHAISNEIKQTSTYYQQASWIGLYDYEGKNIANNYVWDDGSSFIFTDGWAHNSPSGLTELCVEHYVHAVETDYVQWNDIPCEYEKYFFCQLKPCQIAEGMKEKYYGSECELYSCNGIIDPYSPIPCNQKGNCTGQRQCDCFEDYGLYCDVKIGNAYISGDEIKVEYESPNIVDEFQSTTDVLLYPTIFIKPNADYVNNILTFALKDGHNITSGQEILLLTTKSGETVKRVLQKIDNGQDQPSDPLNSIVIIIVTTAISFGIAVVILGVVAILFFIFQNQKKRNIALKEKKLENLDFANLDGIDQITRLENIEKNRQMANIKVNKDIFNIDFDKELRITKKIGSGGFSTVYLAEYHKSLVAFKSFETSHLLESNHNFDAFEKEASILLSMNHPNVIKVFGCTVKPPRVGLVMEYCEKGDLSFHIKDKTIKDKKKTILQIVQGMSYIHEKGLIHRDLKPENIFLTNAMDCKIADFGLSRETTNSKYTQRVGTSFYMAPQLTTGSTYTNKVDVFAFGIMLFEIVTNKPAFDFKSGFGVELKIANSSSFRPSFDPKSKSKQPYQDLMIKCWSHEECDRPTFDEIYEEIKNDGVNP